MPHFTGNFANLKLKTSFIQGKLPMLIRSHLLLLIILLAACTPTAADGDTAVGAQPAAKVTTNREPTTVWPTVWPTAWPTSTYPPATLTPTPTTTPLPTTSTPLPTPWSAPGPTEPTGVIVGNDIWVSGYIMGNRLPDCPFQVGYMSRSVVAKPIGCLTLAPATEEVAAQLTAVPSGDTLLKLTGDLDTQTTEPFTFTVEFVAYVNMPQRHHCSQHGRTGPGRRNFLS